MSYSTVPQLPTTVEQCRQRLLDSLKSGEYALSSSDKEGSRLLCCYRGALLRAAVGEEGSSLLRLHSDEQLLHYLQQLRGPVLDLVDGQPQWRYELTAAEQLAHWQQQVARLQPFGTKQRQFVAKLLTEFAMLLTPDPAGPV